MNKALLYPQATDAGVPIPDAIALPQGYIVGTPTSTPARLALPSPENIVSFYVTDVCVLLLDEDNVYAADTYKRGGYLMLPGIIYSLYIEKDFFRIQHIGTNTDPQYYVNIIQPWGGAGQQVEAIS